MDLQPLTSRRLGIAAVLALCVAMPGMLWAQGETGGIEQTAPDQGITTRALAGTVDMVLGAYQHNPVQNDWHIGSIVQDSTGLRWTNKAGVSWRLEPDLANQRLLTGPDNPYYAQGLREFKLIINNGQITGFTFAGGSYLRISPQLQTAPHVLVDPPVSPREGLMTPVQGVDVTKFWSTENLSSCKKEVRVQKKKPQCAKPSLVTGDFNGDGQKEVIELWANGNYLAMTVYGIQKGGVLEELWSTPRVSGDGPGAIAWLVGDLNGDGRDEVIQPWANDRTLGMIVYGATGSGHDMTRLWGTSNLQNMRVEAHNWIIADIRGDGFDEIIQVVSFPNERQAKLDLGAITYKTRYPSVPPQTDNDKQLLLRDYAPLVWLAQGETYFPSSVEWAFPYLERFRNSDGNYWLKTKTPLRSPSDNSLPLFQGDKNLNQVPVYAFAVEKGEFLDLIYFTFYPYNRGKEVLNTKWGNHVGDWEHITVRLAWLLNSRTKQWSLEPLGMYLSAHNFGGAYPWGDVIKADNLGNESSQGTHPIVYSAWGSHGFWTRAGSHNYEISLTDETSQGTRWPTWNNVRTYDYAAKKGLGGLSWPGWMSTDYQNPGAGNPADPAAGAIYRWGNPESGMCVGECRLNDGPTGPAAKGVWGREVFK
ncbi:MAG: Vps62-related protein [Nitrospirota bacterium]|nr:Vps62-related protein [Nitrospirota bacterium]